MSPEPSRALRQFLRSPDEASFRPVYEASKDLVYTLCLRRLGDEADAMDAFQSVYCRLLSLARADRGQLPEDIERLLPLLAMREADNLRKRRARRLRRERSLGSPGVAVRSSAGDLDEPGRREVRARLEKLVADLPEKLRLPLQLHFFHGLSQRQVARALDESTSTVSHRIRSGLRRLERSSQRAGLGPASALMAAVATGATLYSPRASAGVVFESALGSTVSATAVPAGAAGAFKSIAFVALGVLLLVGSGTLVWLGASGAGSPDEMAKVAGPARRAATVTPDDVPSTSEGGGSEELANASPVSGSGRLRLRVIWAADGAAVEGARVAVHGAASPVEPDSADGSDVTVETDARGEVSVELGPGGFPWRLAVTHPESVERRIVIDSREGRLLHGEESLDSGVPLRIELERDFVVAGTVRDTVSGAPISGAVLRRGRSPLENDSILARSDDSGEFRIDGLSRGELELRAGAAEHAERLAILRLDAPGLHFLDLELDPAARYTVHVLDVNGLPLAGARVYPSILGCHGCYSGERVVETDDSGTAVIEQVSRLEPPKVMVKRQGYRTRYVEAPELAESGFEARVVLEESSDRLYVITGRVTDRSGQPIPGITVEYKDGGGTRFGSDVTYGEHRARTDASGVYRLEFEDDYRYCHLGVGGSGWAPQVRRQVAPGPGGEPVVVDFVLEPAHWLAGFVVDEEGEPLAGAGVAAMPSTDLLHDGVAYPVVYRETRTDGEGRFRLDDLAGPTCAVRVSAPRGSSFPRRDLDRVEVDREVTLVLQRWGVIEGQVVDAATGQAVTEFNVKIRGPVWVRRANPGEAFSSEQGRFVLENLQKDATYGVIVEADGYAPAQVDDIRPADAGSREPLNIELDPGHPLRGTVVDAASGLPIQRARVSFGVLDSGMARWEIVDRRHALENFQRARTDGRGSFQFREGRRGVLFVEASGYLRRIVLPAERTSFLIGPHTLEIPLNRGVVVTGRVELGGQPASETRVSLLRDASPRSPKTYSESDRLWETETDPDGTFAFDGVAPATYGLEISTPSQHGTQPVIRRRAIEVGAGGVRDLVIGADTGSLTLRGSLLEPDGTTPISATLRLRPRGQSEFSELRTHVTRLNESPKYAIPFLQPGTYDMEVVAIRDGEWRVLPLGEIELREDLSRDLLVPES